MCIHYNTYIRIGFRRLDCSSGRSCRRRLHYDGGELLIRAPSAGEHFFLFLFFGNHNKQR